jgi:predicted RNA-binding Zn-ribbon protein involved in translation (DUF1610 family)
MKEVDACPECNIIFECTNENSSGSGYKCPKGHLINKKKLNMEFVPLTVDEAQEYAISLERGETHKYHIGTVGRKVGDILKCEVCGRVTDVVEYDGLTNDENTNVLCVCQEDHDKWYEPCGDSSCEFHRDLDIDRFRKEDEEDKVIDDLMAEIFEKYPPKSDRILELNRIIFLFSNSYGKEGTGMHYIYVSSKFINYCAEHDLLTHKNK